MARIIKNHKFIFFCILAAVVICAVTFALVLGTDEEDMQAKEKAIEDTIRERAMQCYVIEDAYPESLAYLEKNYGLAVNKEDYKIIYAPFAENMPPQIKVIYKGKK